MADTDRDADGAKYQETEKSNPRDNATTSSGPGAKDGTSSYTDVPGGILPAATVHREHGAPMTTTP